MSVWTLNDSREQRDRARLLNAQQYPFKKKPQGTPPRGRPNHPQQTPKSDQYHAIAGFPTTNGEIFQVRAENDARAQPVTISPGAPPGARACRVEALLTMTRRNKVKAPRERKSKKPVCVGIQCFIRRANKQL